MEFLFLSSSLQEVFFRILEKKVGQLMKSRADYKGAYYVPMSDKYINRMQADIKDAHKHNEYNGV